MSADFPIADAHQHFWDPRVNYHPWLCDQPPVRFRYGDYAALRRPFLPADYFADAGPREVVKAVFEEIYSGFRAIAAGFSASEQHALFHDNAVRIYAME